jgi:type VI protein secretion system component VasK
MKTTSTILSVIAVLLGCGSVLLYRQNSTFGEETRKNAEQCEQQIASLHKNYQGEIDALRRYLLEQYKHTPDAVAQAEKPGFNKMISNGHRMQAIRSKYDVILNGALLDDTGKRQLAGLLFEWESLSDSAATAKAESGAAPGQLQASLDDVETRIKALLNNPFDWETFQRARQLNF